ncbi:MAG: NYN domain-containing protein, partial [Acidobacteria bacterium]|nr:NYN domain-containing protein [Acidobacteriota bacterium]
MAKIIWIVDAAYLMKAAPGKFDYLKLKKLLTELCGGEFFESYYLNSTHNPPTDQQDAFHTWLKIAAPRCRV